MEELRYLFPITNPQCVAPDDIVWGIITNAGKIMSGEHRAPCSGSVQLRVFGEPPERVVAMATALLTSLVNRTEEAKQFDHRV